MDPSPGIPREQAGAAGAPGAGAGRRWEPSFGAKLAAGLCGLVLLTGAAMLAVADRTGRASTRMLVDSLFREVSRHCVTQTRDFVLRAAPVAESLGQLADQGLVIDDLDRLAPQLLAFLRGNAGMTRVLYGDESGGHVAAARLHDGGLRVERTRIADGRSSMKEYEVQADGTWRVLREDNDRAYDPRTRPFYILAKEKGKLAWTPPYMFFSQGVPGISCVVPVSGPTGALRGVFSVEFDLNALSQFVSSQSVSEHSRVFLFTPDQTLLAHPNQRDLIGRAGGTGPMLTLADTGDPLVDAFREHLGPEHLREAGGEAFRLFEFEHGGTGYLASTTVFPIGDGQSWVVGAVAPRSDFLAGVWRTRWLSLGAGAGALCVGALLAGFTARRISRPVQALIAFMRRVGAGDLEARADFHGGREFRQLADALNRMIADLRDRLRLRHSLGVAMEVQQRLLPASAPAVRGLDIAGHSVYCDETGGDYYDFLVLDRASPDSVLVVIGDVMGHGVAAALVMAGVRAVLHDRAEAAGGLATLTGRLNRLLSRDHAGDRFMTMHLSVIDARAGTIRWVSAGHDPAIVYDPGADRFEELSEGDPPLGVVENLEYSEHTRAVLRPGRVVLIGTDGVWEMPNVRGQMFGKDRLREVIRRSAGGSAAEIAGAIRARLAEFRGDARQVDDVTFVVVKVPSTEPTG